MSASAPTPRNKAAGGSAKPRASDIRQQVGLRIKTLRIERQLTQDELASRVGTFAPYLSRVENGHANPTLTMLNAVSQVLKVEITELFTAVSEKPAARVRRGTNPSSRGRVR